MATVIIFLLLAGCAGMPEDSVDIGYGPEMAVAVWDLEDFSLGLQNRPDLGEFISARVIETIRACGHTLVERQRLLLALEELNIGSSTLADEATRLEIGRMVGARLMVFGGFQVIGEKMRLDLRLVEVERGLIIRAASKTISASDMNAWLSGAAEAADELCDKKQ
jgi:hypothetical protein